MSLQSMLEVFSKHLKVLKYASVCVCMSPFLIRQGNITHLPSETKEEDTQSNQKYYWNVTNAHSTTGLEYLKSLSIYKM